jgi:hypothetical protein
VALTSKKSPHHDRVVTSDNDNQVDGDHDHDFYWYNKAAFLKQVHRQVSRSRLKINAAMHNLTRMREYCAWKNRLEIGISKTVALRTHPPFGVSSAQRPASGRVSGVDDSSHPKDASASFYREITQAIRKSIRIGDNGPDHDNPSRTARLSRKMS